MDKNPEVDPIYVAGAGEEVEGLGYFDALQKRFPDRVRKEVVPDQFDTNPISREAYKKAKLKKRIVVGPPKRRKPFQPKVGR